MDVVAAQGVALDLEAGESSGVLELDQLFAVGRDLGDDEGTGDGRPLGARIGPADGGEGEFARLIEIRLQQRIADRLIDAELAELLRFDQRELVGTVEAANRLGTGPLARYLVEPDFMLPHAETTTGIVVRLDAGHQRKGVDEFVGAGRAAII